MPFGDPAVADDGAPDTTPPPSTSPDPPRPRMPKAVLATLAITAGVLLAFASPGRALAQDGFREAQISRVDQGDTNWCGPAAVAATLGAYGIHVPLSQIATEMGQATPDAPLTDLDLVATELNRRQTAHKYAMQNFTSPSQWRKAVIGSIRHGRPVVVYAEVYYLPEYSEDPFFAKQYHALTVYGFKHVRKQLRLSVWDSAGVGRFPMRARTLFRAMLYFGIDGQSSDTTYSTI